MGVLTTAVTVQEDPTPVMVVKVIRILDELVGTLCSEVNEKKLTMLISHCNQ